MNEPKFKIGQNVEVTLSRENAENYNGNALASWPFFATIDDIDEDGDYTVEDKNSEFFRVSESEIKAVE